MRIGTRGSALALAQATMVQAALGGGEIVTITTTGDRNRALADKAKWVTELERALADGEIDVAVHSAKDVPTTLPDGLELVGCLPREDPRDALCGTLSVAGRPARVGTASLRRAAQLRALAGAGAADGGDGFEVVEIRGNVDTRLAKLAAGDVDAVVLANAGLRRLGRDESITELLDALVPAAGQGTVVLEARAGTVVDLRDEPTWRALTAERACVHALGADCSSAVGAHLRPDDTLVAWVGAPDGSAWLRDELRMTGTDPAALGVAVAERLLAAGAAELIYAGSNP
ncbi:hydroxymethylbilane synthase [Paraconexibacter antarcticus]|uniref:Hydroxymethylbilane synthase n=1 Tax=Paraconexibacter antarcticus TaxID=2949664 RepID=A0ABY5DU46_9ACTN|nr:hydroxymethylbilane synthase [Paraconexibacter antarcticus]UTI64516.1 hydroxymethylbilane synthase [Paraconexibacter antarcticus]